MISTAIAMVMVHMNPFRVDYLESMGTLLVNKDASLHEVAIWAAARSIILCLNRSTKKPGAGRISWLARRTRYSDARHADICT
jgi:hypothetical protein